MGRERSQQIGTLFVVGVPIGHPDDITIRAHRVLRDVDVIATENPAATEALLRHHAISTALTSYGPAQLNEKVSVLIERLRDGAQVALVADCGSPVISDPGCLLVAAAHSCSIPVRSVPGPSALTAAVSVSGLAGDAFAFQGQLPHTPSAARRCLDRLLDNTIPSILFCTTASLLFALDTMAHMAPRRSLILAVELTKPGEMVVRGTSKRLRPIVRGLQPTQDVTLILSAKEDSRNKRKPETTEAAYTLSSRRINTR